MTLAIELDARAAERRHKAQIMQDFRDRKKRLKHAGECEFVKDNPYVALGMAYAELETQLNRHASGNIAVNPIAILQENDEWTVDVTVKIPGVTDYSVDATHADLAVALSDCARAIQSQSVLLVNARKDASIYGYTL